MNDGAERGFTLLEMVCVLAIIALMAAVLLPLIPRETSRSRLQAYALQSATILKADRVAAINRRTSISLTYIPVMMVFPAPASSASRKRKRLCGNMCS